MKWSDSNVLFVDVETTGVQLTTSSIVEIALIVHGPEFRGRYSSLVFPSDNGDWEDAELIHGISYRELMGAPDWLTVWAEIQGMWNLADVAVSYGMFDYKHLHQQAKTYGHALPVLPWVDALALRSVYEGRKLPLGGQHTAEDDVVALRRLWGTLKEDKLLPQTVEETQELIKTCAKKQ